MRLFIPAAFLGLSLVHSVNAQITARVFNYAAVPQCVLAAAKDEANFVLRTGGIRVTWMDCPKAPGCTAAVLSSEVVILIRPSKPDTFQGQLRGGIIGNAAGPPDGSGIYAWICYDELRNAAISAGFMSRHDLLGYAIVHEIGHLLLGPDHLAGTVMQANWGPRELDLISKRHLRFDAAQRRRMRACIVARVRSSAIDLAFAVAR
jgi:hypothetical protein